MASGSLIDFESTWEKGRERAQIREARETVLRNAEEKAKRRLDREEKEDNWMLPSLEKKLKKKKKKKDKKKKKKKEKKKKKSSSSSSSSDSEDEWVEKKPESKSAEPEKPSQPAVRDDWMTIGTLQTYSRKDLRKDRDEEKEKERREKEMRDAPGRSSKELNPFFKDGGDGIPTTTSSSSSKPSIGDGGASWLRRAFKRAEEQAQREGKSIEEIAANRWGSLENFNKLLAKAEGRSIDDERTERDRKNDRIRDFRRRQRSPDRISHRRQRSSSRDRDAHRRQRSSSRDRKRRRSRSRSPERRKRSPEDRRRRSRSPKRGFHRPVEAEDDRRKESSKGDFGSFGRWKTSERKEREREEVQKKREPSPSSSSSSESEAEEEPKAEEAVPIMTEKEMNALGAKILKAEMMGNDELAKELKEKLEKAKEAKKRKQESGETVSEEVVVLTRTDGKGMTRPVEVAEAGSYDGKRRKKQKVQTHQNRERVRYFADDDKYDLKQMFEREKLSTAEDQNAMMSRLAGKAVEKTNEDYDIDDIFVGRATKKESDEKEKLRERDRAINEHKKMARSLDDCKFCFGSRSMAKHLMIAMGQHVYLALPHHLSLTDGHCFIVPMHHVTCATQLDENVWNEIQEFRRALTKMFRAEDEDCVFFESAMNLKRYPHMLVECVPIPREIGEMAPMYFQKAIQECETEWSHNKKLISLRSDRPLRRAVPKGLPYFHVDFGLDDGFAHVIEDEKEFAGNFAQEIIGGMLDLEPRRWRNPKRESFEDQKSKVLKFGGAWKDFDCTKRKQDSSDSDSDD